MRISASKPPAVVLLVVFVVMFPVTALAQSAHRWQPNSVCHPCIPIALSVADSSLAVMVVREMVAGDSQILTYYTVDGGRSWANSSLVDGYVFTGKAGFDYFTFIPPGNLYLFSPSILQVSSDSGRSWSTRSILANTQSGRFFNPSFGYRLLGPNADLRMTLDSGYQFTDRVSEWSGLPRHFAVLDSNRFWRIQDEIIYRTYDRGVSWETIMPLDTAGRQIVYRYLTRTADTNRLYLIGGVDREWDYLASTDGGTSWIEKSLGSKGRVVMLAEQEEQKLWILMARRQMYPSKNLYAANLRQGYFSDTLYHTSDDGTSWQKDLTFVNDTISDLQFISPTVGYVVSTRDSTVRVWRYVPESAALKAQGYDGRSMYIYPNPASTEIKFYPQLGGECKLRLLDIFGRTAHEEDVSLPHMQVFKLSLPDHLPNGLYFLELVRGDARAGQRFILQR